MRDFVVTLIVVGALPFCIKRPSIGILVFSWISYMNPHRLTWGFAYDAPFAQIIALATISGLFLSNESKKFPLTPTVGIWIVFLLWMVVTTFFAFDPPEAWDELRTVGKIQLMTFVTLYVMGTKKRINYLVWVIAMSLAFYGVKGGIFGILTGGQYRVWGPDLSFIADNNSLALALIMTMPLLRYLQLATTKKYIYWGLTGIMLLTGVAILASQSRGALVGVCAMGVFLWIKSRNRVITGIALLILAPLAFITMPESWHERMETIQNYEQDESAMGRITVWRYTFQLANKRLTAAGFEGIETDYGYKRYAPEIYREVMDSHRVFRAAHSIWFGILGQHGWPGLILFVLLGWFAWRDGTWVIRQSRGIEDLSWCRDLAAMLQVSIVGYAATGTFLSMEYFDFYYHVVAILILLSVYVRQKIPRDEPAAELPDIARGGGRRRITTSSVMQPLIWDKMSLAPVLLWSSWQNLALASEQEPKSCVTLRVAAR